MIANFIYFGSIWKPIGLGKIGIDYKQKKDKQIIL